MNNDKNIENIQISKRLELVLDQLESLTIFDKNSGYKAAETDINKRKSQPTP